MKSTTTWSKPAKTQGGWTPSSRQKSAWAANGAKIPSAYVVSNTRRSGLWINSGRGLNIWQVNAGHTAGKWTPQNTKTAGIWTGKAKAAAVYVATGHVTSAAWSSSLASIGIAYKYDDAAITYDSIRTYDYVTPITGNQLNKKIVATWSKH